ncbi:MAG: ATP-binding protein, partial [Pseudomonadota bacterium]
MSVKKLKDFLPRSLFYRSLLILTVPIILTFAISTYVFFDRHWEKMASRLATGVAGEVAFFSERFDKNMSSNELDALSKASLLHLRMNIQHREGGVIEQDQAKYFGRGDVIKRLLYKELKEALNYPFRIVVDVEEKWIQVQVQKQDDVLIFTVPESRLFSSSGYVFLLWMLGVSIILMTVAIIFMRNQIRPIKKLSVAADRFGKGRDVPFFKPEGAREVRQAARAFIGMRDRMQNQIQQRTLMLAGVSHDLRTPLTRLKLQAEMIEDESEKAAIKEDIDDMERMISAYLEFTKGEGNETPERVNLKDFLQDIIGSFEKVGFALHFDVSGESFDLYLRPIAIERCLNNIISNAQKFAEKVWVSLEAKEEQVVIRIDDDGPGVDPANYQDVFKPFYREEKSRNKKTGGVGLGLPIAQDIVLA